MDYLTIVQTAMNRAKAREGAPSSISGAVGLGSDFANWVGDAWRDLQESDTDWWFRQKLDQTLAITAGTDAYAMPSGLETLNYRTISVPCAGFSASGSHPGAPFPLLSYDGRNKPPVHSRGLP